MTVRVAPRLRPILCDVREKKKFFIISCCATLKADFI